MSRVLLVLALFAAALLGADGRAAAYARAVQSAGLDPEQCFRVRDITFQKDDLRFFFNDGHLIFAQPVEGKRLAAVYTTSDLPGADGEVIVLPPYRSERQSLARFAKAPNLNEHFVAAVFLFSDDTGNQLLEQIAKAESPKSPETGLLLAQNFADTVRNLWRSYEIRLVQDHFAADGSAAGFFYAAIRGKTLGNIDLLYDPRARDQILIGQIAFRDDRRYFDIWTSFPSRGFRTGRRQLPASSAEIRKVTIDATLDAELAMKATTRIEFTATRAESALPFELSRRMRITSAKLDGEPVEVFARESLRAEMIRGSDNAVFMVVLPRPVEAGRTYTIEFEHEGNVVTQASKNVYYVASRMNWYPNRQAAFALYDITFHYPKGLQLVATGERTSEKVEGETRTVRHTTSSPIRFAGFNLGDFERIRSSKSGVEIEVCANRSVENALRPAPPEIVVMPQSPGMPRTGPARRPEPIHLPAPTPSPNPAARLQQLTSDIGAALEFMATHFGPPPLKTLAVAPIPGTFGQGFAGLLYLSTLAYLNPGERPPMVQTDYQRLFYSELLHAHETAHQWWGNLVTTESYQDDWLMEALANYSGLLTLEKKKGRRALDSVLEEYRNHLVSKGEDGRSIESAGPIIWGVRLDSSQRGSVWRTIVYEKGSWIVHMLRERMGDERFLQMLGELARRKRYKPVTTEEFRELAAEFLPPGSDDPKLETFFATWVFGTGIPKFHVKHTVSGKAPNVRLRVAVTQSGVDEEFSAWVPVDIQLPASKRPLRQWVQTSAGESTFTLNLKQQPAKVTVNPAFAVLTDR